jgi:protein MpaA
MSIKPELEILSKNKNIIRLYLAQKDTHKFDKTVLFIGVFHGDEPDGKFLIEKLMNEILINPNIIGNNRILFIPCLNPDGMNENKRVNSNNVDLNRNFPTKNWHYSDVKNEYFPGDHPGSEIETNFIIKIIGKYKPDRILTIHSPYAIVNYDGPAKEIACKYSELTGYPVQKFIGYQTPGSFGAYAGEEMNIPTITLELPENTDLEILWQVNKKGLYYFIS